MFNTVLHWQSTSKGQRGHGEGRWLVDHDMEKEHPSSRLATTPRAAAVGSASAFVVGVSILPLLSALAIVFGWTVAAHAELQSRLGGLAVYDTDLDITWLSDVDASPSGFTDWDGQNAWAAGLTVGGFSDWRLPRTLDPDPTCEERTPVPSGRFANCTGSEMGHLFYEELSGNLDQHVGLSGDPDLALFTTFTGTNYWSETEWVDNPIVAWHFNFGGGGGTQERTNSKENPDFRGLAVRDGDVGPDPDPAVPALGGEGLVALGVLLLGACLLVLRRPEPSEHGNSTK